MSANETNGQMKNVFFSFFKKIYEVPKNLVLAILIVWAIIAVIAYGFNAVPQILISVAGAVIIDLLLMYAKEKKTYFPESGIISGLIIALVLSVELRNWYVLVIAGAIAMLSKHFIVFEQRHIFNPANFGLLLAIALFGSRAAQTWWGASIHFSFFLIGLIILYRLSRFHQWIPFIATVIVLSIAHHFLTKNPQNAFVYAMQVITGLLFFSFIMLMEPVTSPQTRKGRMIFGFMVAIIYFFAFNSNIYVLQNYSLLGALAFGDLLVPLLNKIK